MRARDLGIALGDGEPGPRNAITDVAGVRVGHTTLIEGDSVRTGVTMVVPPETPLFAGCHRLNGNGELTGLEWVRESGLLTTPIGITNTFSVGVVRDAIAAASADEDAWSLPVVGETFDGFLNDIRGQHVTAEHAHAALEAAEGGAVEEGSVGGGTGMICHEFKGGIGTASRKVGGLRRRRPRPGELRPARAFPRGRRSRRPADRRPDPATAGRRRVGLDHRDRRDGRAACCRTSATGSRSARA